MEEQEESYRIKEDGTLEITLSYKLGLKFLGYQEEEEEIDISEEQGA